MTRVLHLYDRHCDYQTETGVSQLTRDEGGASRSVGHGGDYSTTFIGVLRLRDESRQYDLVHAWGEHALTIAALGSRRPIVYSPTRMPMQHDLRFLRATMGVRDVQVVCSTDTMRRAFVTRGVPIERCHLVRPGVDFARVNRRRDDELRRRLTFGPDDFVLLAPSEALPGTNHEMTILTATVLNVYDPKYKLLMWGRGPKQARDKRYSVCMLPPHFIAFASERLGAGVTFHDLLPAADAVLITANRAIPTLPIAMCMAAGFPIVSYVTPTVSELLEDRHTALMVGECRSRLLARRVLDLHEDPQLVWTICDNAKTEAFEYFSMTRFVSQFRSIYGQYTAGKPVEVPQQAPGAGMRFIGRG